MVAMENPALAKFAAQIESELVLAQVLITRKERGYDLRHIADRSTPDGNLRLLALLELRTLAQFTASGAFRPLKSAPNLQSGWRVVVGTDAELEAALRHLYPGAIADWFASQTEKPPVTHFRDFTNRQTGMYRITALLNDEQAAQVIKAGCHKQVCLKRRLWSVASLGTDPPAEKSLIPCLEPCAVLLEFARTAMRIEQREKRHLTLSPEEATTFRLALQSLLDQPVTTEREADFSSPANRRRIQLLLEKLRTLPDTSIESEGA